MKLGFYQAIATLIGATIGAGILGIPFVVAKSGFLIGMLHILLIGTAIIIINLYVGEIALRTKKNHQLTGYAEQYLGKKGKKWMVATMIGSIYGALIAYTIGVGQALHGILPSIDSFWFSIGFFVVASAIVFIGLKAVKESELLFTTAVIILAAIIIGVIVFSDKFSTAGLATVNFPYLFLPFGVVLFAFLGAAAVPEMKEELGKNTKKLKKAIIIGGIVPILLYGLFALE